MDLMDLFKRFGRRLVPLNPAALPVGRSWRVDVPRYLGTVKPGKTIFDVGANEGQSSIVFHEMFPGAQVHAFEPFPATFEKLRQNVVHLPRVKPYALGLSDRTGESELHVSTQESSLNSLLGQGREYVWSETAPLESKVKVRLSTLDSFCEEQKIAEIDFLKIDVQGVEHLVLKGASQMLARGAIRVIRLEVLFVQLYEGQASFHELLKTMAASNMAFCGLYDLVYQENRRLAWGDALFVQEGLLPFQAIKK
jgi:FkbM family methyltransferase